jgi:hypothetical protein
MSLSIDERTEILRVIQMLTAVTVKYPEEVNLSRSIGVLSTLLYPIGSTHNIEGSTDGRDVK